MCEDKFKKIKHPSNARTEMCCLSARALLIQIDLLFDKFSPPASHIYSEICVAVEQKQLYITLGIRESLKSSLNKNQHGKCKQNTYHSTLHSISVLYL
jgi:hypothetical protein